MYFKGSQVANTGPWMRWYDRSARVQDTSGIIKDVEESLDGVRDDLHVVRAKTEGAVEATTLGIKPS